MGLGFKQAGFEIKGAWDFDKYAVESYKHNVGDHVQQADISKMDFMDLPFADVWTFGFPCQDLSVAGKQAGMIKGQTRSGLFFEITRLLNEVREKLSFEAMPKVIMAENVKGLKKFLPVLEEEYEAAGYKMYLSHQNKGVLNSKYWGVPQNRERYFVVGVRKDIAKEFTFPEQQTDFIPKLSSVLEENVDEKYYISDEKAAKIIEQAKEGLKVRQATKKGYDIAVEGDSINISHPNSKTRRGRVGKQVAQTLLTGTEQVVVESKILRQERTEYGKQIRKAYESGEIQEKIGNMREFRPRPDEISNTLTSVDKDNYLLETLGSVHACITPDRVDKRQNGRRAKEEEEAMFTVTAQDTHGVIIKDIHNNLLPGIEMIGLLDMKGNETVRRVYDPECLAPTLKTSEGGHRQPKVLETEPTYRVRKLTPREYARLQGFPDSYEQIVSNSQFYKQMGNAVTVNVARAIAERIQEFLKEL